MNEQTKPPSEAKRTVLIIHGTYGYPTENWIPWLSQQLEAANCQVIVPQFPTPEGQNLANWLTVFEEYRSRLDQNSLLVGHSIGASFLLSILELLDHPVSASFFVSGFASLLPNTGGMEVLLKSFVEKEFDWEKIRRNGGVMRVFYGDNDPYVPIDYAGELARNLNAPIVYIPQGGHLNESAGYTEFTELWTAIRSKLT